MPKPPSLSFFSQSAGKLNFNIKGEQLADLDHTTTVTVERKDGTTRDVKAVKVFGKNKDGSDAVYARRDKVIVRNPDGSETTLWRLKLFGDGLKKLKIETKSANGGTNRPYLSHFRDEDGKYAIDHTQIGHSNNDAIKLGRFKKDGGGIYQVQNARYYQLEDQSSLSTLLRTLGINCTATTLESIERNQASQPYLRNLISQLQYCASQHSKGQTIELKDDAGTPQIYTAKNYAERVFKNVVVPYVTSLVPGFTATPVDDDETDDSSSINSSSSTSEGEFSDTDLSDTEESSDFDSEPPTPPVRSQTSESEFEKSDSEQRYRT